MQGLLQRSDRQADSVESITAAVEQMQQSVASASEHTKVSDDMAKATVAIVHNGTQKMANSISSVERIVGVVNESRATLLNLHESIQRIKQLTQMINDVAEDIS